MYRDPARLRTQVVKVRFSREEDRLLEALADYTGEQKAVLVRDLILAEARALLGLDSGVTSQSGEGARGGLGRD